MRSARLYSDENFPLAGVEALRELGLDVLTIFEDGRGNRSLPDGDVLSRATDLGRAILNLNRRDFIKLHLQNEDHAGVVVCTRDADLKSQASRIASAIEAAQTHGSLNRVLLRVNRPGSP